MNSFIEEFFYGSDVSLAGGISSNSNRKFGRGLLGSARTSECFEEYDECSVQPMDNSIESMRAVFKRLTSGVMYSTVVKYIAEEDKLVKLLENQHLIKTPIVRNGKQSTIGYQPEIWKTWN